MIELNLIPKKKCTKCGLIQPLLEFTSNRLFKDGRQNQCRNCRKQYLKTRCISPETEGTKRCCRCKTVKSVGEFHGRKSASDGLNNVCADCACEKARDYRVRYATRIVDKNRIKARDNPFKTWAQSTLTNHRANGYLINITRDALESLARNASKCKICNQELRWHFDRFTNVAKLTHNSPSLDRLNNEQHISSNNIQILCHRCNTTKGPRTQQQFIDYCVNTARHLAPQEFKQESLSSNGLRDIL